LNNNGFAVKDVYRLDFKFDITVPCILLGRRALTI